MPKYVAIFNGTEVGAAGRTETCTSLHTLRECTLDYPMTSNECVHCKGGAVPTFTHVIAI